MRENHGAARSSTKINVQADYGIWTAMKARCNNPKATGYKNYGGRGIKVCKEWSESFIAFAAYIRTLPGAPTDTLLKSRTGGRMSVSLDRINNNKNYKPGNIRWSSTIDQNNNTRSNTIVSYKGDKGSLSSIVKKYAVVSYNTVLDRINKLGWSLEKALLTPRRKQKYKESQQ